MLTPSDFRKGLRIEVDGKPYEVIDYVHTKPGKGGALYRTRIKSLIDGRVLERTFKAGEPIPPADIDERPMQFIYKEGNDYVFMDLETYEQISLSADQLGRAVDFLTENLEVTVLYFKGEPLGVELPNFVVMEVVHTEPGVRGDTVSGGGTKPATVETGAVIQVPLFVEAGDRIKVDTRSGKYVERA